MAQIQKSYTVNLECFAQTALFSRIALHDIFANSRLGHALHSSIKTDWFNHSRDGFIFTKLPDNKSLAIISEWTVVDPKTSLWSLTVPVKYRHAVFLWMISVDDVMHIQFNKHMSLL